MYYADIAFFHAVLFPLQLRVCEMFWNFKLKLIIKQLNTAILFLLFISS